MINERHSNFVQRDRHLFHISIREDVDGATRKYLQYFRYDHNGLFAYACENCCKVEESGQRFS